MRCITAKLSVIIGVAGYDSTPLKHDTQPSIEDAIIDTVQDAIKGHASSIIADIDVELVDIKIDEIDELLEEKK